MDNIWKKNAKLLLIIVLDIFIISGATYAATTMYASNTISYDNTTSGLDSDNVQGALDRLYVSANNYTAYETRLSALENNFLDKVYPVGSIFFSTSLSTTSQVASTLGGTWEVYGSGRTIVGVGTGTDSNSTSKTFAINETAGEYSHTLSIDEMPSHTHTRGTMNITGYIETTPFVDNLGFFSYESGAFVSGYLNGIYGSSFGLYTGYGTTSKNWNSLSFDASRNWTGATSSTGGSQSHNNIQPYIALYMYKRTA